ncbi:MAG: hypothetical protein RKO68_13605 [Candidatus Accumulibacter sp.]|nr:hypothetical protein [Accumulibacter sp.]
MAFPVAIVVEAVSYAAAEAAKAAGVEFVKGLLETLFNQQSINNQLVEINKKLDQIISFLKDQLPELLDNANDRQNVRVYRDKIFALTGTLNASYKDGSSLAKIKGEANQCFDAAMSISQYSQGYFLDVCIGFAVGLSALKHIIENEKDEEQLEREWMGVITRAHQFQILLEPAVNEKDQKSILYRLNQLQAEYSLAAIVVPQITGKWGSFLISYKAFPVNPEFPDEYPDGWVYFYGGSFTRLNAISNDGRPLQSLPIRLNSGEKFLYNPIDSRVPYPIAPWWPVNESSYPLDTYNSFAASLNALCQAHDNHPTKIATLFRITSAIQDTLMGIREILDVRGKYDARKTLLSLKTGQ